MKHINRRKSCSCDGSVLLVSLITILILLFLIGTTLVSTTNKYFTAYQWASWQEALQGAESGADIAIAELRKDMALTHSGTTPAWAGWKMGKYGTMNGVKVRDPGSYKTVASDGTWLDNSGGGNGNTTTATIAGLLFGNSPKFDYLAYSTNLTDSTGVKAH